MNNDYFIMSNTIRQWFSQVTALLLKMIGESLREWPKALSTVIYIVSHFLHAILCLDGWSTKKIIEKMNYLFQHCHQEQSYLTQHLDTTIK